MPTASPPLLKTKLFMPRIRPGAIQRPRLTAKLRLALERKVTLLSAPAGFGKTSLLAEWWASLGGERPHLGWVTLDEGDQDPARFWLYLLSALEGAHPGVTGEALSFLRDNPPAPIETVLLALVNALTEAPGEFLLVLDDLHRVESEPVAEGLRFLVEHLPPSLHLILLSRIDPPLPLTRLRATGDLVEVRAHDLRFTEAEAAALLGALPEVDLSPEEMRALVEKTEGWIAALQLAGLSLQGRADAHGFIATFVSSHQYLVDFLVEEILQNQTPEVQQFLLQTSVLERLSGPLCEAVTSMRGAQATLTMLEQRGLFTVALDPERQWFRYHHLFAEILRAHLQQQAPAQVAELQRKACGWFQAHGMTVEAVRAALAAGDHEESARLIEEAADELWAENQVETLRTLLGALPERLLRSRPRLMVHTIRLRLIYDANILDGEGWLIGAREALERSPLVGTPEGEALGAQLTVLEAIHARASGDVGRAVTLCQGALASFAPDERYWWPMAASVLTLIYQATGEPEAGVPLLQEGCQRSRRAQDLFMAVLQTCLLGDLHLSLGRLRDAYASYEQALVIAGEHAVRSAGWAHVGLGAVLYEWNQVEAAKVHLTKGLELGRRYAHLDTVWRAGRILTYLHQMQRDVEQAWATVDLPEISESVKANPMVRAGNLAQLAQQRLLEGELAEAALLADKMGDHLENALGATWPESLTPARVMLARGRTEAAIEFLQARLALVQAAGEVDPQIRALVLLAQAWDATGDSANAVKALEQALALAEPEGYRRVFLDEGEPLARLLQRTDRRPDWLPGARTVNRIGQAGTPEAPQVPSGQSRLTPGRQGAQPPSPVEPLTDRELETLRLAADGLSNQEIGARLFITPGTVKNHLHNIMGKLGTANRLQAINRARDLGLL